MTSQLLSPALCPRCESQHSVGSMPGRRPRRRPGIGPAPRRARANWQRYLWVPPRRAAHWITIFRTTCSRWQAANGRRRPAICHRPRRCAITIRPAWDAVCRRRAAIPLIRERDTPPARGTHRGRWSVSGPRNNPCSDPCAGAWWVLGGRGQGVMMF